MQGLRMKALLAAVALGAATVPACLGQTQKVTGDWEGTLDAGGTVLQVAWHVTAKPDGTLVSTVDNKDENVYGIKATSTVVNGSKVTVTIDDTVQMNGQELHVKGELEGTLSADGTELKATYVQEEPASQPPMTLMLKHVAEKGAAAASGPGQNVGALAGTGGDWEGTLNAGGAQLRLVLHVTEKDGGLSSTLDSVDQGANGIPVSSTVLSGSKLNLTVAAVNGSYEGTISKDGSEITGTWTQGQPMELNFHRAQPHAAAKPGKPSDIDGTWTGMLDAGTAQLHIIFKLVNMEDGLSATMQSPDQAPVWVPANSVERTGNSLTITFRAFNATYVGKIGADLKSIDGTFTQMGRDMPLVVKKT